MPAARGGWQAQGFTTDFSPAGWTPRLLEEWFGGYVQESRQGARDHGWGSVCAQPVMVGREGDLSGVVFKTFHCHQGFSGLVVGTFQSLSMSRESAIRNKHNGFYFEPELSGLVYFWF